MKISLLTTATVCAYGGAFTGGTVTTLRYLNLRVYDEAEERATYWASSALKAAKSHTLHILLAKTILRELRLIQKIRQSIYKAQDLGDEHSAKELPSFIAPSFPIPTSKFLNHL